MKIKKKVPGTRGPGKDSGACSSRSGRPAQVSSAQVGQGAVNAVAVETLAPVPEVG